MRGTLEATGRAERATRANDGCGTAEGDCTKTTGAGGRGQFRLWKKRRLGHTILSGDAGVAGREDPKKQQERTMQSTHGYLLAAMKSSKR
jgi:hypothetical protein